MTRVPEALASHGTTFDRRDPHDRRRASRGQKIAHPGPTPDLRRSGQTVPEFHERNGAPTRPDQADEPSGGQNRMRLGCPRLMHHLASEVIRAHRRDRRAPLR